MPGVVDPETMYIDDLPGIWSPVQWELSEEEKREEIEQQAQASLLWSVSAPEAILRLLLDECEIERALDPPDSYDPELQGEWDESLVTFKFRRSIRLDAVERERESLCVIYDFGDVGYWEFEITPEKVILSRI
ncbi:MAG: hypothetical protein AMJ88_04325 [Anaerolineae bacterium SM23_ 63]|nr:MAG: hypothetical protein AMJ88_04325 [Anaerolineae bacterium SM23_ 63]HEY45247.1 plasmid pRiA4b ORF-3 family protein [Anaerolineae bacterium]